MSDNTNQFKNRLDRFWKGQEVVYNFMADIYIYMEPGAEVRKEQICDYYVYIEVQEFDVLRCGQRDL